MPRPKASTVLVTLALFGSALAVFFQQRRIAALHDARALTESRAMALARENRELVEARKQADEKLGLARAELATLSRQRAPSPPSTPDHPATPTPADDTTASSNRPPLHTSAERQRWHERYDQFLLGQRGLTPAQAERIIDLWIRQSDARADLQAAVEQQNLTVGPEVEKIRNALNEPITREIMQILGDEGYKTYREYSATSAFRGLVDQALQPRFTAAGAPLTEPQHDQLARLLSANKTLIRAKPTDLGSQAVIDWPAVIREASTLLTPAQLAVLQAYGTKK